MAGAEGDCGGEGGGDEFPRLKAYFRRVGEVEGVKEAVGVVEEGKGEGEGEGEKE